MPIVDLAFPLISIQPIPADHGYFLYGALSRVLPQLHETNGVAVHPIRGQQIGNRQLQLNDRSRLVLRADADHIGQLIALAGKQLDVAGHRLRVGVPQVWTLRPAPALRSRLVTIKGFLDPEPFQAAARRHLDEMGVSAEAQLTLGKRRTLRIKDKEVVGYEVLVEALSAEESLVLQERGLGGRRHMGCGVFVAIRDREGL
ncbi:MAG: type I-MYXAN CRISPR-associated protein Cas6/Cmx6 [Pirellulaceae bacterium]